MNEFNWNLLGLLGLIGLVCGACSDAERAKLISLGSKHRVVCYSGGSTIYDGVASGKVLSEQSSDGYYFEDQQTGKLMEVSGDCVITRL